IVLIGSQECSERMLARNDWRFVCGSTSNVHVVAPLVAAGAFGSPAFGWMVTVPRQVPARNDGPLDGAVGPDEEPPHAEIVNSDSTVAVLRNARTVIPMLLDGRARSARTDRGGTDRLARRTHGRSGLVSRVAAQQLVQHAQSGGWPARSPHACFGAATRRWPSARNA